MLVVTLAVIVAAVPLGGCGGRGQDAQGAIGEAVVETTASVDVTATGEAGTAATGGSAPAKPLTDEDRADLEALERELEAIEAELDGLSMPADSDFKSAEEALF